MMLGVAGDGVRSDETRAHLQASLAALTSSKSATARSRVYLVRSRRYQFFKCGVRFVMQVGVRLASNQLWDNGGQHGQESEEGESNEKEEGQEEVGPRQHCRGIRLRHIKARALCHREAGNSRCLMWFSEPKDRSRTTDARRRRTVRLFFLNERLLAWPYASSRPVPPTSAGPKSAAVRNDDLQPSLLQPA